MRTQILILFLFSIFASCDGTLGGFQNRNFNTSKANIVRAIDSFYISNPKYIIAEDWKTNDNWKTRGYDFLDSRIFYFENEPKEMYYVSFIGDGNDSIQENKNSTSIAIRSVFTERKRKRLNVDQFDEKEKARIEQRFDDEIIYKLEKMTNANAKREK